MCVKNLRLSHQASAFIIRLAALCVACLLPALLHADDGVPERCYDYCAEAAAAVAARVPGYGRGTYAVEYHGGPHGRSLTHAKATFEAWFTETNERIDLHYEHNHDRFPRALIVRAGNLHFSHRFPPAPGAAPMVITTGIYSPDTRPVLHGLIVDPAAPHLMMLDVRNVKPEQVRFRRLEGGRIEGSFLSATEPGRVVATIEVDPSRGYLPVRQRVNHGGTPGAVSLEVTYGWERVGGRWFCKRFEAVNHGDVVMDGQTYQRRVCRLAFDDLELVKDLDPKLFRLDSLEIPPGTVVGDLRKDAAERYFVYQPERDPRQQELDQMVEAAKRLALTAVVKKGMGLDWRLWAAGLAVLLLAGALYVWQRRARKTAQRLGTA